MESLKITLAGKEFSIASLTLGQIEDLSIAIVLPDTDDPQENIRRSYSRTLATLTTALRKSFPDMTAQALRDMTITREELSAAYSAVLRHSGLMPKENAPGEAGPAEQPA
jgi:hypothetical protein